MSCRPSKLSTGRVVLMSRLPPKSKRSRLDMAVVFMFMMDEAILSRPAKFVVVAVVEAS